MGIKPFYYHLTSDNFIFASEIKAILTFPHISRKLDDNRIYDHFTIGPTDKDSTFYKHIKRLPPGSQLILNQDSESIIHYHKFERQDLNCKCDKDYEEQFKELFAEAVRCRLRSYKPVGSFLSGGLDSSSIVCVASSILEQYNPPPLQTFSGIFETLKECDERSLFKTIIDKYPITPHYLVVDELSSGKLFDEMIATIDEPFLGAHSFMCQELYKIIKEHDCRTIFDGHDGDSALSHGNNNIIDFARSGRILALAKELKLRGNFSAWDTISHIFRIYRDNISPRSHKIRFRFVNNLLLKTEDLLTPDIKFAINREEKVDFLMFNTAAPYHTEYEHHLKSISALFKRLR